MKSCIDKKGTVKFSLIIGTLDRPVAIESCMKSIQSQTYTNYEVIVIDQSNNRETELFFEGIRDCRVKYFHVPFKGLSKARNEALRYAEGEYICLIDDDASYDSKYLELAACRIGENNTTVYSGYIWDTVKNAPFVCYKDKKSGKRLSMRECIRLCPSAALFIPMKMIRQVGGFDEQFGVGGIYGAAEETDLLIRGCRSGYKVVFAPELKLMHPVPIIKGTNDEKSWQTEKMKNYYKGVGAMYKKHFLYGRNIRLLLCFIEVLSKLLIKKGLILLGKEEYGQGEMEGFFYGLKNYGVVYSDR